MDFLATRILLLILMSDSVLLTDLLPNDFELSQSLSSQEYYREEQSKWNKRKNDTPKDGIITHQPKSDQEVLDMLTFNPIKEAEVILAPESPKIINKLQPQFQEDHDLVIPKTPPPPPKEHSALDETSQEVVKIISQSVKRPPLIPVGVIRPKKIHKLK